MTNEAHIETVTKGPNQRVRRTVAYRVVAGRQEIARFNVDGRPDVALAAARKALQAFEGVALTGECPHLPSCGCKDNECLRLED